MKKLICFACVALTLVTSTVEARRGAPRGRSPNRAPSAQHNRRPVNRQVQQRPVNRQVQQRPVNRQVNRDNVRPGNLDRVAPVDVRRPQNLDARRVTNHAEARNRASTAVRKDWVRDGARHRSWYNNNFWAAHPHPRYRFDDRYDWWRPAAWATVGSWVAWNWGRPVLYDYEPGGYIYYDDNQVYVEGEYYSTAQEYAEQADEIVSEVPQTVADQDVEFLPLGVFAVTSEAGDPTNQFIQLAITKDGIISGTFQNSVLNDVQPLEGKVDQKSQRAIFRVIGKEWPIFETGMYNLVQKETAFLIHFGPNDTKHFLLVRVEEPKNYE